MNSNYLLIQSLQNPTLYTYPVDKFRVIETHISWVLLTGRYAYKIKKPLNLGFLDFSSLEKRKHYCHEELRLNSRLAPDIYLAVVAIRGTPKQPELNGSRAVIEYAVKMRQFEPNNTFDQLIMSNQLTTEHIRQTARIIVIFHDSIPSATIDTEFGSPHAVIKPVRKNFSQIQQQADIDKPDALEQLEFWVEQQYNQLYPVFKQRKQAGFIRECHGDLHLGNIALINNKVVPFDGIEFNPSLYWIDVINEIAFLTMDLQEKQRSDLSFQFLNVYLENSGDYAGLKLLRFYQLYRAMVRAKVSAIRASQSTSARSHELALTSYHDYLRMATTFTQTTRPFMTIMHGVSGSGKSWLSEQIIERLQVIRIRSDVERKRLHNLSAHQNSHSTLNSGLYKQSSSDMTYQRLLQLTNQILESGYSVIVDATFLLEQYRKPFSKLAEQLQIPFIIVHTRSDKQTLVKRIKDRAKQQNNVSEANQAVMESQLHKIQPLSRCELKNCITVNTSKTSELSRLWNMLGKHVNAQQ